MSQGRKLVTEEQNVYWAAFRGQSNRQIAASIPCHHSAFSRRPDILAMLELARTARASAVDILSSLDTTEALRATCSHKDTPESVRLIRAAEQRSIERRRPR